jgi:hypothetical protein
MNTVTAEAEIHAFITARIMSRLSPPGERRNEALREVLKLTVSSPDTQKLESMIAMAPEIPLPLYAKWVSLFADRLLETVSREQLQDLCANSEESNATLLLLYSMFMESERMERMAKEDLHALNHS